MSMDAIRKDLVGVVHVYVGEESVFLRAGDEVPEGLQVREDVLAESGDPHGVAASQAVQEAGTVDDGKHPDAEVAEAGGDVPDEDLPAEYDSREAWNAYAESVGFDPSLYSKKEALIEALKQR